MMQRSLARRSNGPRVIYIFPEIRAVIDPGNNHVRFLRQKFVQRNNDAIRRRPIDRPLSLADLVANNRLPQRQRLRRSAALQTGRNYADRREAFERLRQRSKSLGLVPVIIGQKNVRHDSNDSRRFAFSKPPHCADFQRREHRAPVAFPKKMVGAPGFEPGTSRTPSVRATRLRYAPTGTLITMRRNNLGAEPRQLQQQQGYHRRSISVKKARRASRKSSKFLRLRSCAAPSVPRIVISSFSAATLCSRR